LPGESQGRGSLVGCRLWGCTELDTTEATEHACLTTDTEKMGNRVQETEKQGQSKVRREGRATVEKPGEKAKRMCRAVITT